MKSILTYRVVFAAILAGATVALGTWVFTGHMNVPSAVAAPGEVQASASTTQQTPDTIEPASYEYIEVVNSCGPYFAGTCVNMRSGPGTGYPAVMKLRTGVVLKVTGTTVQDGRTWYKIGFDEELRYPERVTGGWFVAAGDYLQLFTDEGVQQLPSIISIMGTKRIVVDLSEEMLYAYDGDSLFMQEPISTGLELTPTPHGTFVVYRKTPSRYMQGPIPEVSDQYYDLPGVPWDLYFSYGGAVIHGAYWHDHFGQPWSHGCVNLPPQKAKELYYWADIGTSVTVQD